MDKWPGHSFHLSMIVDSRWDALKMDNNSVSFYNKVSTQFVKKTMTSKPEKNSNAKACQILKFTTTFPVSSRSSKEELDKSKFHRKNY